MKENVTTIDEDGVIIEAPKTGTEVAEFDPIAAGLEQLKTAIAETSYDITTTKGLDAAKRLRQACVKLRTSAGEIYESLNRPMLDKQALIRKLKAQFVTGVEALEAPIDAAIKAQESVKESDRQARVAAEAERVRVIRERLNVISALPAKAVLRDAAGIAALDQALAGIVVDEAAFAEFTQEAEALKAFVRNQLGELFVAATNREAEAERVRQESVRMAAERETQALRQVLLQRISDIKSHPLQAIGQDAESIERLIRAMDEPDADDYGDLHGLAMEAYHQAATQLAEIFSERRKADQIVEANRQAEVAATALRQRELTEQAERQRVADEQHDRAQKQLQQQQDAFEAERAQERQAQAARDAAAAEATRVLRAEIAALQPKPEPKPESELEPVVAGPDWLATLPETVAAPVVEATEPALELLVESTPAPVPIVPKARPSDLDLATLVATTYRVNMLHAIQWLVEFDSDAVNDELEAQADLVADCPF